MPIRSTSARCYFLETMPIMGTKDIATTMLRSAMTGLCGLVIHLIPVVVGEFFTCCDISDRYNPDDTPELFGVAVWVTRMIDIACRILGRTAIDGIPLVQSEDIGIASD